MQKFTEWMILRESIKSRLLDFAHTSGRWARDVGALLTGLGLIGAGVYGSVPAPAAVSAGITAGGLGYLGLDKLLKFLEDYIKSQGEDDEEVKALYEKIKLKRATQKLNQGNINDPSVGMGGMGRGGPPVPPAW